MHRDFIQETIDMLRRSANNIETNWIKFKNGEITKEEFEEEYRHILVNNVLDEVQDEAENHNNGCKYNETCPTQYFISQNI